MSAGEATPQEIYDVIKKTVEEQYYCYKNHTSRAYELLALLNGNGKGHIEAYDDVMREKEYYEPSMPPWGHSDMEALRYTEEELNAMCDAAQKQQDKVKKWVLPVDNLGECYFVSFPDDLLEAANLKEGDQVEWIDNGDGSYLLKKVVK